MTTSGTYSFLMSRDDTIKAALRLTTRFGAGDTIPTEDIDNCAQALNILCKALVVEGLPLWCVQQLSVPFVVGQAAYDLSTFGSGLPVRVLDCFWRSATGNDVQLSSMSRYDYNQLGEKASPGNPNQYYYDRQLTSGKLVVYNVPADSASTLQVTAQRQIQDVNLGTQNLDFTQEAYQMLKWTLADEIALEYSTPRDVRVELAQKAAVYREKFFSGPDGQENASVGFQPNMAGGR
jgi:hypothetical protein